MSPDLSVPHYRFGATLSLQSVRANDISRQCLRRPAPSEVDGTAGSGAINATLTDSTASLNASNGIDAVSGPGNATVDIMRVVAASNGSPGIQSHQASGGAASVTVGSSVLRANAIGIQAIGDAGAIIPDLT